MPRLNFCTYKDYSLCDGFVGTKSMLNSHSSGTNPFGIKLALNSITLYPCIKYHEIASLSLIFKSSYSSSHSKSIYRSINLPTSVKNIFICSSSSNTFHWLIFFGIDSLCMTCIGYVDSLT